MASTLRVLIVDDSLIYRKAIRDALAAVPDVEVVGVAADGKLALEKARLLQPDLITLDQEMPELDGLGVLEQLPAHAPNCRAIMLSSLTARGTEITTRALRLGAFDFVCKPAAANPAENMTVLHGALEQAVATVRAARGLPTRGDRQAPADPPPFSAPRRAPADVLTAAEPPQVLAIGISTGGPAALSRLIPVLPRDLPLPVLIVQHMPPLFTQSLAADLDRMSKLNVREADDGRLLSAGEVLIAPGGRQMKVALTGRGPAIQITDDPPERNCRPSVDYLFRSLAATFGGRTLAVMMTGMGDDGALGCRLLKRRGARILAQDEASCVVFGMPKTPIQEGLVDEVAPLELLAERIVHHARQRELACR